MTIAYGDTAMNGFDVKSQRLLDDKEIMDLLEDYSCTEEEYDSVCWPDGDED